MGRTVKSMIIYGIKLDENAELPWSKDEDRDIEEWWLKQKGYKPTFYPYTKDGEYKEGVSKNDPRLDAYYEEKSAFIKANRCPFDTENYGSSETQDDVILTLEEVPSIKAYWGDPTVVEDFKIFDVPDKYTQQLIDFCKGHVSPQNTWHIITNNR